MQTPAVALLRPPPVTPGDALYRRLLDHARFPEDPRTLAFAGVIVRGMAAGTEQVFKGLSEEEFQRLMRSCFPGVALFGGNSNRRSEFMDEYDDLVNLLMEYRIESSDVQTWLCHAVASASMHDNHLWQDLGLPGRAVLSQLMRENFPALAERNSSDMKWKKFFYRQLCEKAQVMICKSPNCKVCTDFVACFGPEEGVPLLGDAGSDRAYL